MIVVPSDVTAPTTLTIAFKSLSLYGVDATTVTGVTLNMTRRDGTTATLTCTIVAAVPDELTVQYTFVGTEVTSTGIYYLAPRLTVPGGTLSGSEITMSVVPPSAATPVLNAASSILYDTPLVASPLVSHTWHLIAASATLGRFANNWVLLDTRGGSYTLSLWAAVDGDTCIIVDVYAAAASNPFTLHANGSQQIFSAGSGSTNLVVSSNGAAVRLKFSQALGAWIQW